MNKTRNKVELIVILFIMATIICLLGAIIINGITQINNANVTLVNQTESLQSISKTIEYTHRIYMELQSAILRDNADEQRQMVSDINNWMTELEGYITDYKATIYDVTELNSFSNAMNIYESAYKPGMEKILLSMKLRANQKTLLALMGELGLGPAKDDLIEAFTKCKNVREVTTEDINNSNNNIHKRIKATVAFAFIITVIAEICLLPYIRPRDKSKCTDIDSKV